MFANVPPSAIQWEDAFLDAVCKNVWLKAAYETNACGSLASGLRQWALHQSVPRIVRFHNAWLGYRIKNELVEFENVASLEQSQIIQLLGCASLAGWGVGFRALANVNPASIARLPVGTHPHRFGVAKIEDIQYQLWLGLRTFVFITRQRLPLPDQILDETLKRWRENLADSMTESRGSEHRVNFSMVEWLEECRRQSVPGLIPAKEPLWVLTGFPFRLEIPNRTFSPEPRRR
jgi:hypothetical protein